MVDDRHNGGSKNVIGGKTKIEGNPILGDKSGNNTTVNIKNIVNVKLCLELGKYPFEAVVVIIIWLMDLRYCFVPVVVVIILERYMVDDRRQSHHWPQQRQQNHHRKNQRRRKDKKNQDTVKTKKTHEIKWIADSTNIWQLTGHRRGKK